MPSGSLPRSNSAWTVRKASWAYSRATSTEILISLVVIIWMLMPFSARARNIRSATPGCVAMPRPTIEIFATSSSQSWPSAPSSLTASSTARMVCGSSSRGTEKEMSARPSAATFWAIMSMGMFLAVTLAKIVIAAPGRSGTPSTVTRASFLIMAAPQTGRPADFRLADDHRAVGLSLKLLRTWTGTQNFLANSIDRLCITPAPAVASSSISS